MRSCFIKKLGCVCFALLLFIVPVYASAPDDLETVGGLSAQSHCLLDADTGKVLKISPAVRDISAHASGLMTKSNI